MPLATNLAWCSASACNSAAYISDKQRGWLTMPSGDHEHPFDGSLSLDTYRVGGWAAVAALGHFRTHPRVIWW